MRAFTALLVFGIVVLSACAGQPQPRTPNELLSCKCERGVVMVSETGDETTYKCDDALCPGAVSFECWQRTCNFASVDKSTGDVERFDGKCCEEPGSDIQPPAEGGCASDSDCVPASCCHPTECTAKENAPDCSGTACTMECAPGTLDCGAGKCVCDSGNCRADIQG